MKSIYRFLFLPTSRFPILLFFSKIIFANIYLQKQQDNSAKLRDAKRKQLELSHRVLNIITRQEMTRKLGFTIQLEEEKLRMQLEALQSQISAPTQFKGMN